MRKQGEKVVLGPGWYSGGDKKDSTYILRVEPRSSSNVLDVECERMGGIGGKPKVLGRATRKVDAITEMVQRVGGDLRGQIGSSASNTLS